MRRFRSLVIKPSLLVIAVLLLSYFSLRGGPAPGGGIQSSLGDLNCDRKVDITDAIHLLRYIFQDGPPLCDAQDVDLSEQIKAVAGQITELQSAVASLSKRLPSPRDIVTVRDKVSFPAQGGTRTLFKVPEDKWFVLMAARAGGATVVMIADGKTMQIPYGLNSSVGMTWPSGVAFPRDRK